MKEVYVSMCVITNWWVLKSGVGKITQIWSNNDSDTI